VGKRVNTRTLATIPGAELPVAVASAGKPPDIASASVDDTLATLRVNPDAGLAHAEVEERRKTGPCTPTELDQDENSFR